MLASTLGKTENKGGSNCPNRVMPKRTAVVDFSKRLSGKHPAGTDGFSKGQARSTNVSVSSCLTMLQLQNVIPTPNNSGVC